MKNKVLTKIKEKHNRCSIGLGTFKHELQEVFTDEQIDNAIKQLIKEKKITERVGTLGTLYNYKN